MSSPSSIPNRNSPTPAPNTPKSTDKENSSKVPPAPTKSNEFQIEADKLRMSMAETLRKVTAMEKESAALRLSAVTIKYPSASSPVTESVAILPGVLETKRELPWWEREDPAPRTSVGINKVTSVFLAPNPPSPSVGVETDEIPPGDTAIKKDSAYTNYVKYWDQNDDELPNFEGHDNTDHGPAKEENQAAEESIYSNCVNSWAEHNSELLDINKLSTDDNVSATKKSPAIKDGGLERFKSATEEIDAKLFPPLEPLSPLLQSIAEDIDELMGRDGNRMNENTLLLGNYRPLVLPPLPPLLPTEIEGAEESSEYTNDEDLENVYGYYATDGDVSQILPLPSPVFQPRSGGIGGTILREDETVSVTDDYSKFTLNAFTSLMEEPKDMEIEAEDVPLNDIRSSKVLTSSVFDLSEDEGDIPDMEEEYENDLDPEATGIEVEDHDWVILSKSRIEKAVGREADAEWVHVGLEDTAGYDGEDTQFKPQPKRGLMAAVRRNIFGKPEK